MQNEGPAASGWVLAQPLRRDPPADADDFRPVRNESIESGRRVKLALVEKHGAKAKRRKTPWVIGTLMVVSLALLVILQSTNLWKEFTIESSSDLLLLY